MLILFGTIGAIFHGAAFPCMIIFYGQMTENFVQWSICDEMVAIVNCRNYYVDWFDKTGTDLNMTIIDQFCDDGQFTFDIQLMDEGDCPDDSVITGGSEG